MRDDAHRQRLRDMHETLGAVLHARAFAPPAPGVAQVVADVRADLSGFRFEEYGLVWAARHELPPTLAIGALLADPPTPMRRTRVPLEYAAHDLIDEPSAYAILEHTVRFDQAYETEVCRPERSDAIVSRLFGLLRSPVFWTARWMTDHTFDCGVVAADAEHVVVLWLADED